MRSEGSRSDGPHMTQSRSAQKPVPASRDERKRWRRPLSEGWDCYRVVTGVKGAAFSPSHLCYTKSPRRSFWMSLRVDFSLMRQQPSHLTPPEFHPWAVEVVAARKIDQSELGFKRIWMYRNNVFGNKQNASLNSKLKKDRELKLKRESVLVT